MASETTKHKQAWLFILLWPPTSIGGVSRVVLELCRAMKSDGRYQPIILVSDWSADKPVVHEHSDYIEINYRLPSPAGGLKSLIGMLITLPKRLTDLSGVLSQFNICVVNPHYPELSALNFVFLKLIGKKFKLILSVHGVDLKSIASANRIDKLLWKCVMAGTDTIVACSHGLAGHALAVMKPKRTKVVAIHNGVSVDFLQPSTQVNNNPNLPEKYILSVGTFEYKKGQDLLIKAFAKITDQYPDLYLVLLGRSGIELPNYKQLVVDLHLESKVLFFEDVPLEKITAYYLRACFYVSASREEPFGIVMLEAGSLGVPVVATKTQGACEILNDGVDGILVELEDIDALTGAMEWLLMNREGGLRYADAFKAKVISQFTWENALRAYYSVLN
jgi:glycosyltransferase involved in cell wall biosynthesis